MSRYHPSAGEIGKAEQRLRKDDKGNTRRFACHRDAPRTPSNGYAVSLYSFIFRHSVTVLMFNASAARFRLPL